MEQLIETLPEEEAAAQPKSTSPIPAPMPAPRPPSRRSSARLKVRILFPVYCRPHTALRSLSNLCCQTVLCCHTYLAAGEARAI